MTNIEQRITQLAKNLAVASIFSQHPEQDDDYDRVMQADYPTGVFSLAGFYLCEDYQWDHPDQLKERLEAEYDKLTDFARAVFSVKQVWKMEYDWDGGVICDVIVCSEQEAQAEYLYQLNQLLLEGEVTKDTLDQLEEAMGVAEHPFWQMHRPVIYYANYHEVHDGY